MHSDKQRSTVYILHSDCATILISAGLSQFCPTFRHYYYVSVNISVATWFDKGGSLGKSYVYGEADCAFQVQCEL